MKVLFQNASFIAVDKEPGMLSVPARLADDPRPVLGRELEKFLSCPVFPVHRLDAEVSGLVLYALNPEAHRDAGIAFENRKVKKTYQAFTRGGGGFSPGQRGEWKAKILRGKKRAYESPAGKLAVTAFEVCGQGSPDFLEWRLFPKTGRSHQLRWELYRHESPILGDQLYGSNEIWSRGGVALKSLSLEFEAEFNRRWELPPVLSAEPWSSESGLMS